MGTKLAVKIVLGNEKLLKNEDWKPGVGPRNMVLCAEHSYVPREIFLDAGKSTVVCFKCLLFTYDMGSVIRVKSPGERGIPEVHGGAT